MIVRHSYWAQAHEHTEEAALVEVNVVDELGEKLRDRHDGQIWQWYSQQDGICRGKRTSKKKLVITSGTDHRWMWMDAGRKKLPGLSPLKNCVMLFAPQKLLKASSSPPHSSPRQANAQMTGVATAVRPRCSQPGAAGPRAP